MEDDNTVQEQIELAMLRSWGKHMTNDIISLRLAAESAIFYLQCDPELNHHMITLLKDTLNRTFNPDMDSDNGLEIAA